MIPGLVLVVYSKKTSQELRLRVPNLDFLYAQLGCSCYDLVYLMLKINKTFVIKRGLFIALDLSIIPVLNGTVLFILYANSTVTVSCDLFAFA